MFVEASATSVPGVLLALVAPYAVSPSNASPWGNTVLWNHLQKHTRILRTGVERIPDGQPCIEHVPIGMDYQIWVRKACLRILPMRLIRQRDGLVVKERTSLTEVQFGEE